ncbi:hypothetical protein QQF64_003092 [Cirrhinus molitorella]|uniref:Uncharacterized protein n=1 Tax=Cirrhinus molitorella TaxID=172907 RepID=A0ABR3MJ77_9TELE
MEELKQTMRDVGRHMLNDPPSGAQRSRWRLNLGKCWELMFTSVSLKHTFIITTNTWSQDCDQPDVTNHLEGNILMHSDMDMP